MGADDEWWVGKEEAEVIRETIHDQFVLRPGSYLKESIIIPDWHNI